MSTIFPKSANALPLKIVVFLIVFGSVALGGITYYATPKYTRIGYAPDQPVPYDHSLHVGQLGIDCRYCHVGVEISSHSTIPSSDVCMSCHSVVRTDSELLAPIRASYESGDPVPWVRVHVAPDYVYFDHAVHVNRGISCYECHGNIHEMEVVEHVQPFSMAWCLDCHRQPELHLRPLDEIYNLDWHPASPEAQLDYGREMVAKWKISPPESCSGCHR